MTVTRAALGVLGAVEIAVGLALATAPIREQADAGLILGGVLVVVGCWSMFGGLRG